MMFFAIAPSGAVKPNTPRYIETKQFSDLDVKTRQTINNILPLAFLFRFDFRFSYDLISKSRTTKPQRNYVDNGDARTGNLPDTRI